MADHDDPRPRKGGCFSLLGSLILLLVVIGLGWAVFNAFRPQSLADVGGYGPAPAPSRDVTAVLRSSLERGYPVTFTEAELNGWLKKTLEMKQDGLLADSVKLRGAWIKLRDGHAEVVLEREVFGNPVTTSIFLTIDQTEGQGGGGVETAVHLHGGPYHPDFPKLNRGGKFGQLTVPQGFLLLVLPAFEKMGALFSDEISLGFERMARVKIEDKRITFSPHPPGGGVEIPGTF